MKPSWISAALIVMVAMQSTADAAVTKSSAESRENIDREYW